MLGLFTKTGKTFENLTTHEGNNDTVKRAKEFCLKFPDVKKGLLFMGQTGTGKTHLAQAIANRVGKGIYWASMSDLLAELRPGSATQKAIELAEKCHSDCHGHCSVKLYKSKPYGNCLYCSMVLGGKHPVLGRAAESPLLVLDDLGTSKPTDWVAEQIYMLLNSRLERENPLPVIGTTNYTLEELEDRLGHDRSVSRLVGLCEVHELTGDDWRLKVG